MMDEFLNRKVEIIYTRSNEPTQDVFFDDPFEAIEVIASVLHDGSQLDFIAVPSTKCFDFTSKEIYYNI